MNTKAPTAKAAFLTSSNAVAFAQYDQLAHMLLIEACEKMYTTKRMPWAFLPYTRTSRGKRYFASPTWGKARARRIVKYINDNYPV